MAVVHPPSTSNPTLHVPEPQCRPGDSPRFDGLTFPPPGDIERPELDVDPQDILGHAYGLIRVLDDEGHARGPWNPDLDGDELVEGLRHLLLTRELDRRMLRAQRQGKTSFYMQSTGEEAIACGFQASLDEGDMNFPTYRQQGLLVAAGYPLHLMMCQVFSNECDPLRGRQMPVFYSARSHGFFSISGNLATQYVQAVGWAMAAAIRGEHSVAAGWIGDGATAESDFHSAMVLASTYNPPAVLNIVNNQWAISTFQAVARGRAPTFAARGHGFGIPSIRVDGNDYLAVRGAASWATARARAGHGPTVIEWVTYRVGAHSSSDDPSGYRPKDEAAAWPLGDPVDRLRTHCRLVGALDDEEFAHLTEEVEAKVASALTQAEEHGTLHDGPRPSPKDIFEGVYAAMPDHLRRQRQTAGF
ncbi:MAG: 3-methyl-2-oxobutanoate dehydrogenase (2-methylpropanoyl-transferring) subunit alpha [Actinomycetota bacterium]|nr:3-methyl-2-oxobutanoate dehydrogenase (2-methylpropanoyl-transferring) subunit alpha [Actinomycetota bacterium]